MRAMLIAVLFVLSQPCFALEPPELADMFRGQVQRRLDVPADADRAYRALAQQQLAAQGTVLDRPQMLVVVDRNALVQALIVYVGGPTGDWQLVGASPVSTGVRKQFDHYITPTGVWDHDPDNASARERWMDFRAQGTRNELGVRGYGRRGMRIWDIGWTEAVKGWGKGESGRIRLQLHATDPDLLERRLGTPASKGCIRLSAQLNSWLDRVGALDWHLEQAAAAGKKPWVLRPDRLASDLAGRYLIVLDSGVDTRPDWAALPPPTRHKHPPSFAPAVATAAVATEGVASRRP